MGLASPNNGIGSREVNMKDGFSNALGIRSPHDSQNEAFKNQYQHEASANMRNSAS